MCLRFTIKQLRILYSHFAHIDKLILICAHSLLYTYVQGVCTHPWSWQLAASPLPHQSDADVPRLRLGSAGVARSSMMVLMYSTTSPAMVGPSRVQSCSSTSVSRVVRILGSALRAAAFRATAPSAAALHAAAAGAAPAAAHDAAPPLRHLFLFFFGGGCTVAVAPCSERVATRHISSVRRRRHAESNATAPTAVERERMQQPLRAVH